MSKKSRMRQLESIVSRLAPLADTVSLLGDGAAAFIAVTKGSRGFELYLNEEGQFTIDPSEGDELLGEVDLDSENAAVAAGMRWIERGERP